MCRLRCSPPSASARTPPLVRPLPRPSRSAKHSWPRLKPNRNPVCALCLRCVDHVRLLLSDAGLRAYLRDEFIAVHEYVMTAFAYCCCCCCSNVVLVDILLFCWLVFCSQLLYAGNLRCVTTVPRCCLSTTCFCHQPPSPRLKRGKKNLQPPHQRRLLQRLQQQLQPASVKSRWRAGAWPMCARG